MRVLLLFQALADAPVEVGGTIITTLPAPPLALLSPREGVAWVLTAEHELQAWKAEGATWTLAWSRSEPDAVGLFLADGRPWIERHEVRAEPLEEGGAVERAGPAAAGMPAPVGGGKVLRVGRGEALVDLGRKHGLKVGSEFRFLRSEAVDSSLGEDAGTAERQVGTGTVRGLEAERALVALSRGSRVQKEDLAEVHPGADGYPLAPERLGALSEVGVVLRPLLALDTLGVAFVNEAWASYAFASPWYLEARLSPAGLGWSQDGNPLSVAAVGAGGLDNRWFAVGLGAGWSMLNQDVSITSKGADESGGYGEELAFEDVRGAFSLAQQARLGARDGLSLVVRNTFVLVPEYSYDYDNCLEYYDEDYDADCVERTREGSGFAFGGIAMRGQVPAGDRTDLFVDWGTGQAGATWVTGGVSSWVRGNGDSGSIGLEVAAGYGQVTGNPEDQDVTLYGPLVSAGLRWRGGRTAADQARPVPDGTGPVGNRTRAPVRR